MTEFIDRNGVKRRLELSNSYVDGWIKVSMEAIDKRLNADTWEMPRACLQELEENIINLIEEKDNA